MRKPGYGILSNKNEALNSSRSSFDGNNFIPRYGSLDNSQIQNNDRLYFKISSKLSQAIKDIYLLCTMHTIFSVFN